MPNPSFKLGNSNKLKSGFTFIELLLAVVIMSLLMGVGFANYRGFQQRQQLKSAARSFKADLRFAQAQALSGTKPSGCVILDSYRLLWVTNFKYDVRASCDAGAAEVTVKSVDMTNSLIRFNAAFTAVNFKVLGRGTNLAANLTIRLVENATPTNFIDVVITPGGEIN